MLVISIRKNLKECVNQYYERDRKSIRNIEYI